MHPAADAISMIQYGQHIWNLFAYFNYTAYMWPPPANVKGGDCYDVIIVGGGTAGCIIAKNLVELNMNVLVVEAGSTGPLEAVLAGTFPYLQGSEEDWKFKSVPNNTFNRYLKDNVTYIQQGKVLGGSSQVNYMFYEVAHYKDYNEWAAIVNDSSWNYTNIQPLIKRTEKVIDKHILKSRDIVWHGTKGDIKIKKYHADINNKLFESYKDVGQDVVNDLNRKNPFGYTPSYFTIGEDYRQSTAYALKSVKYNPHLHIMYNSLVTKIIFNKNNCAVGVEILTKDKKHIVVRAKKEVVVTAGAIKTPQLLMLSGIGPKIHLESKGIKVISDLAVGKNLQDNPLCIANFKLGESKPSCEPLTTSAWSPPPDPHQFAVPAIQGLISMDKTQRRSDYLVISGFQARELFIKLCSFTFNFVNSVCTNIYDKVYSRQLYFVTISLLHPESRGDVCLNSTDPEDHPIINPGYYSNEKDIERHAKSIEHHNEVLRSSYFKSVNAEFIYPDLEACDGMERGTHEYWKCYVQSMSTTLHNYVGTCGMGSVVDNRLRVIGVKSLRVADSSVIPKIIGAAIQATVMMVAQKASDMIAEDHCH